MAKRGEEKEDAAGKMETRGNKEEEGGGGGGGDKTPSITSLLKACFFLTHVSTLDLLIQNLHAYTLL